MTTTARVSALVEMLGYRRDVQRSVVQRREVLAVLAGLPLLPTAACSLSRSGPGPRPARPLSGDAALVARVLRDEQQVLRRIDEAVAARPGTRVALEPARTIVATHIDWLVALHGGAGQSTNSPASSTGSPGTPATGGPAGPVFADRAAAMRSVTTAMSGAADDRLRSCVEANAGPLAQLLASMAASYTVLVEELRTS